MLRIINLKIFKMKKISILFASFLFVFASCSSDDDNTDTQVDSTVDITGSWELKAMEYEGESTQTAGGQTLTVTYEAFGKDFDAQVVFTEDPNEVTSTGTYTIEMTMTSMGQSITQDFPVDVSEEFISASEWSIDGNVMTLISEGETQTAEIITLTQNLMVLLTEQTEILNGAETTVVAEFTLER